VNLLCLFKNQKYCIGFGISGLYFHLVGVFFSLRLLKLVFISHRSDTGYMKESSSPGVAVSPCPRLEVTFKPKVPSHIQVPHRGLTLSLESRSFPTWETEAQEGRGKCFPPA